jgi:hypothetical protein
VFDCPTPYFNLDYWNWYGSELSHEPGCYHRTPLCVSFWMPEERKRERERERMSEWWKCGWAGERGRETAFITRKLSEDFMAVKFRRQRSILLVNIGCTELERWEERIVQRLEQIVRGGRGEKRSRFHICAQVLYLMYLEHDIATKIWCCLKGWMTRMQSNVQFWYKIYYWGTPQKTLYSWPSRRNFRIRTVFLTAARHAVTLTAVSTCADVDCQRIRMSLW